MAQRVALASSLFRPLSRLGIPRRLFWVCMLAVHAGALHEAWIAIGPLAGENGWFPLAVRALAQSLAAAFFGLKVLDVSWLRLNPGWRSAVAAFVVIALLHVGAIERAASGRPEYCPSHAGAFLCITGALGAASVRRRWGVPPSFRDRVPRAAASPFALSLLTRACLDDRSYQTARLALAAVPPRAPPSV